MEPSPSSKSPASRVRRIGALCMALCALLLCGWQDGSPGSVPASRQADTVFIITIEGEIDSVTSFSVQRRLREAAEAGADAIVLEIDSPGGEIGAVIEITGAIKLSTVPITVAWIHPQAYSGGAIIALACREIVVSPGAQMGDAFPITMAMNNGRPGIRGLTPDERTKFLPPLLADVVDSARRAGYDEYIAQAIVTDGIELWLVEENGTGRRFAINEAEYRAIFDREPPRLRPMIPHVSGSRQDTTPAVAGEVPDAGERAPLADEDRAFKPASPVLEDLTHAVTDRLESQSHRPVFDASQRGRWTDLGYLSDGSAAIVMDAEKMKDFGFASASISNDEQLRAFFGATSMVRLDESWSEAASRLLTSMGVRFVLIAVFLLALFIEMASPGLMLPGTIAIVAGLLLIAPPMIIGMANWWEIGAILLGIVLIVLEIFVLPGFGVFGIVGLVALFGGMVGTFVPDGAALSDPTTASAAARGMATILLGLATAGIGMYFVSKHFGSLPLLNRLILQDRPGDGPELSLAELMDDGRDVPAIVGDEGVTTTPLKPIGQAEINDRIVDVVSDLGFIDAGTRVRVTAVGSMRVIVEPVEDRV